MKIRLRLFREETSANYIDILNIDLQSAYDKYNHELFDNKLPNIPIEVRSLRAGGEARGDKNKFTRVVTPTKIILSNKYHFTYERFENVLVHEMIHIWNWVVGDPDHDGMHGLYFRKKMQEINAKGYNINTKDINAVIAKENKKEFGVFIAHRITEDKYIIVVFDKLKEEQFLDKFADKYWSGRHKFYLFLSTDNQLLSFPRPRDVKNVKYYLTNKEYVGKLLDATDSTKVASGYFMEDIKGFI